MKKYLARSFLISISLLFSRGKPPTKKQEKSRTEVYDPDKLPPGEVACGRFGIKNPVPCECMKVKEAEAQKERDKCNTFSDRLERAKCKVSVDACSVPVRDHDSFEYDHDGVTMPAQCSRSCSKAKCECCRT